MALEIHLDNFEGPLDLLLHLIRKNEMDIYDIRIAEITEQYLAILDAMTHLNLDVAGEFLVMAATLLQIKSGLLLPRPAVEEAEDEELDPRAELVRRLLEYQKYKDAGAELDQRPVLGREIFARKYPLPEGTQQEGDEFVEVGLYDLVEAFRQVLRESPAESFHEINVEHISITERINLILSRLQGNNSLAFGELFASTPRRAEVVSTFLAMLELVKMRTVRLMQNLAYGTIWLFPAVPEDELPIPDEDASYGYC